MPKASFKPPWIFASESWGFTSIRNTRKVPDITFKESEIPEVGTPSVDQLRVFLTVVETGSFAAAGRRLGRATSAVSYTIANLETQLGIALFDCPSALGAGFPALPNQMGSLGCRWHKAFRRFFPLSRHTSGEVPPSVRHSLYREQSA
jgi:hypothetical protein